MGGPEGVDLGGCDSTQRGIASLVAHIAPDFKGLNPAALLRQQGGQLKARTGIWIFAVGNIAKDNNRGHWITQTLKRAGFFHDQFGACLAIAFEFVNRLNRFLVPSRANEVVSGLLAIHPCLTGAVIRLAAEIFSGRRLGAGGFFEDFGVVERLEAARRHGCDIGVPRFCQLVEKPSRLIISPIKDKPCG
jgi:hypothetical protein